MPYPTVVINVVGLTSPLIGESSPHLAAFRDRGQLVRLKPVLPAVTCSVQSSMLTGLPPREHGIVGNGWFDRELVEVHFWKQSSRLVHGEKVWETARRRDPGVTCANMFWWFNMYSSADFSVTPRPIYKADGRKIPDCHSNPPELRDILQDRLGRFPLFKFWGPGAAIDSSRWIAAASKLVHERHNPTLMLVYLPHLDYCLQKFGPEHPHIRNEVAAVDAVVGELLEFFRGRGVRVMILSEYGIEPVDDAVHINLALREAGGPRIREEEGLEMLDHGGSDAFAVSDHQIAHVYVKTPDEIERWRKVCEQVDGVEQVLDRRQQTSLGIDHDRSGDLVLVSAPRRWFSYDWWLDPRKAPDFARTVDIHRKPGYDPLELFIDPRIKLSRARLAWKLLQRKLGLRALLNVIPLDTSLVRGSHGRIDQSPEFQPVLITSRALRDRGASGGTLPCTAVRDVILDHLFE